MKPKTCQHYNLRSRSMVYLVALLLFISCEKDVKMQLENSGGSPTIYSFIEPFKPFEIRVSKSVSMLATQSHDLLGDARCEVYKNGTSYQSIWLPNDTIGSSYPTINFTHGDSITIQLFVDDIQLASASTVMPSYVDFDQIDTARMIKLDNNGVLREYMNVKLSFTDPLHSDPDFYQLVFQSHTIKIVDGNQIEKNEIIDYAKNDKIFNSTEQGTSSIGNIDFQGLFADYITEGESYTISVDLPIKYFKAQNDLESKSVDLLFYHLSPEYYNYARSRMIAFNYNNLPIFEPVRVFSNINGGLGLVGGISSAFSSFVIQ